jgi:hypothetical protein
VFLCECVASPVSSGFQRSSSNPGDLGVLKQVGDLRSSFNSASLRIQIVGDLDRDGVDELGGANAHYVRASAAAGRQAGPGVWIKARLLRGVFHLARTRRAARSCRHFGGVGLVTVYPRTPTQTVEVAMRQLRVGSGTYPPRIVVLKDDNPDNVKGHWRPRGNSIASRIYHGATGVSEGAVETAVRRGDDSSRCRGIAAGTRTSRADMQDTPSSASLAGRRRIEIRPDRRAIVTGSRTIIEEIVWLMIVDDDRYPYCPRSGGSVRRLVRFRGSRYHSTTSPGKRRVGELPGRSGCGPTPPWRGSSSVQSSQDFPIGGRRDLQGRLTLTRKFESLCARTASRPSRNQATPSPASTPIFLGPSSATDF